ncbi:PhoH family protein [Brackiella oedipodis]|uniref:PhoH family protein n=1 Tax=Brackiella oedipodis TaxID=124225 RepID=UPI000684AB58|nr:PhoH family protein [Brackiella oedipodis]
MAKRLRPLVLHLDGDNMQLANLCGPLDENLQIIADRTNSVIGRHGNRFTIESENAQNVRDMIEIFHRRALHKVLGPEDIQLGLIELSSTGLADPNAAASEPKMGEPTDEAVESQVIAEIPKIGEQVHEIALRTRRPDLRPRTPSQRQYICQIQTHDVTFGAGPAGTGKTWLAVACAVDALERDNVQRLVLTRPAVEAGERLGFLPGDLAQKVDPYLRPLYDALYDLMGYEKVQKLFERQVIEIAPLAYMRGRTLNNAFVILDEAQNTSKEQMKMFLTRLGFNSKAVITGDPSQIDLPKGQHSGLKHALSILKKVEGVAITEFSSRDVVRHPLVSRIIDAYDKAESHQKEPKQKLIQNRFPSINFRNL